MTEAAARTHVMKISCAESLHRFAILQNKNRHVDPMDFTQEELDIEDRAISCCDKSIELCEKTPCQKFVNDYIRCRNESRINNCVHITDKIADCVAKHVGKLN